MNKQAFFHLLAPRPVQELHALQNAYWISKNAYREQSRSSSERNVEHSRRVAERLIHRGKQDTSLIILALLHEVLEDTAIPTDILVSLFGIDAWRDLEILSSKLPVHDPVSGFVRCWGKKDPEEYFARILEREPCRWVKVADHLDNLCTCGDVWEAEHLARYVLETERRILPIAQKTDPILTTELEQAIQKLKDTKLCNLKP